VRASGLHNTSGPRHVRNLHTCRHYRPDATSRRYRLHNSLARPHHTRVLGRRQHLDWSCRRCRSRWARSLGLRGARGCIVGGRVLLLAAAGGCAKSAEHAQRQSKSGCEMMLGSQ
jgi:hypothetical protein